MPPPILPILQQLDRLSASSPGFQDQLSNILHGEEYFQCVRDLQGDDLVRLVDCLDKVCRRIALPTLRSSQRRLLMASIPPLPLPKRASVSSEGYAALGGYSQHRTSFHLTFSMLVPSHSPRGVTVICSREPSVVRGFALHVFGFMNIHRRVPKFVTGCHFPSPPSPTRLTGLLPRGRSVETLNTPEHRTTPGCHSHSLPAYLRMDVWWAPTKLYRKEPRGKPTWTCRYPSCCVHSALTPVPS
jgi:hypothetical protein